jgi:hypothetical protein
MELRQLSRGSVGSSSTYCTSASSTREPTSIASPAAVKFGPTGAAEG